MYMYKLRLQVVLFRCILFLKEILKLEIVKCEWKYKYFDIYFSKYKDILVFEYILLLFFSFIGRGGRVFQI